MNRFILNCQLFWLIFGTVFFVLGIQPLCAQSQPERVRAASDLWLSRLVRIDTIGGLEKVDGQLVNSGTATGLLLDREGYVLTSAYHLIHKPTSILLRFHNGTKKMARQVATDRNRMLTLLKVEALPDELKLPEMNIRTKDSIILGEPCLVLGVVLSADSVSICQGIVSGKDRIWGKALQTDAAVGPNNYGGPMIDLDGRIMGIAVPLSMMSNEVLAGSEMYDAGVGLAIPMEDIIRIGPKLKQGNDLKGADFGYIFKENRTFIGPAELDDVRPDSPFEKAGFKSGDRIIAIDGQRVNSAREMELKLRPRYADEKIEFTWLREGQEKKTVLSCEN